MYFWGFQLITYKDPSMKEKDDSGVLIFFSKIKLLY